MLMVKSKTLTVLILLAILLFCPSSLYAESSLNFYLKDGLISVDIKNMPLKTILEHIEKECGFWFHGDEDLLNQKVSVQFEKMSLIEGLNRILFSFNHAKIFKKEGQLEGIFIAGSSLSNKNIRGNLSKMTEPPMTGDVTTGKFSFDHPAHFEGQYRMPDDEQRNTHISPSSDKPDPDQIHAIGPGTENPPENCPGNTKKPEFGPGSNPPRIQTPPLGE